MAVNDDFSFSQAEPPGDPVNPFSAEAQFARGHTQPNGTDWITDWFSGNTPGYLHVEVDEQADVDDFLARARKLGAYIEVPDELLDDKPLNLPPTPWRWRLRNKISDLRAQAAKHAYRIIAGYDPPNESEIY